MINIWDYHQLNHYLNAVELSYQIHAHQKYGSLPFTRHLTHVENVLHRFGVVDYKLFCAARLHDALEDTATTYEQLEQAFNTEIADLIFAVTDGHGANRQARKIATYPKIRANSSALILKLADRIASIETSTHGQNYELVRMYKKEHVEFSRELKFRYDESEIRNSMWDYLDSLLEDND